MTVMKSHRIDGGDQDTETPQGILAVLGQNPPAPEHPVHRSLTVRDPATRHFTALLRQPVGWGLSRP